MNGYNEVEKLNFSNHPLLLKDKNENCAQENIWNYTKWGSSTITQQGTS
jgi:hypothetical protein